MAKRKANVHHARSTKSKAPRSRPNDAAAAARLAAVGFRRIHRRVRQPVTAPVMHYSTDVKSQPLNPTLEISGPGLGIRCLRDGSDDFSSFAELAKSLVHPGMTDTERLMAVYRFSSRNFVREGIGFGNTEATRFMNCYGYSFCWGQADFQHLLCEAAGLRARSPMLPGHSTVEVLIDGKWRMMDAYMRLIAPSMELDGLATGRELTDNPQRWGEIRDGSIVTDACQFWGTHGGGGTYEPWQDSRSMLLALRRGESLTLTDRRLGAWCLSQVEPADYCNGRLRWRPTFDDHHLQHEVHGQANLAAGRAMLRPLNASQSAWAEYRIHSPYPLTAGKVSLAFNSRTDAAVRLSLDGGRSWCDLHRGTVTDGAWTLDGRLSLRARPTGDAHAHPVRYCDYARHDLLVRIEWTGPAALARLDFDFMVQIHAPSVPRAAAGRNKWTLIGGETGGQVTHAWDECPEMTVSDATPLVGDAVTISTVVHNKGPKAVTNVPVRFTQAGCGKLLGVAKVARIAAGVSAVASIVWRAAIHGDRSRRSPGAPPRYVNTIVQAHVPGAGGGKGLSAAAEAILTVRPRPAAKFNDGLTWSSDTRMKPEGRLVLRAALVHNVQDPRWELTYVPDSKLSATITPYLGHPDRGGVRLAEPKRLERIEATEFGIAEWTLQTKHLPGRCVVWFEAVCDEPVDSASRRLLARRAIRTR